MSSHVYVMCVYLYVYCSEWVAAVDKRQMDYWNCDWDRCSPVQSTLLYPPTNQHCTYNEHLHKHETDKQTRETNLNIIIELKQYCFATCYQLIVLQLLIRTRLNLVRVEIH